MTKEEKSVLENLELHPENNFVLVSVNPKIFPLEVVYSAAYSLMDKAYSIIDGDPEEEIFVELKPKDGKMDLEKLGRDFNNELLNYAVYMVQTARNRTVRDALIQRAFLTNSEPSAPVSKSEKATDSGVTAEKDISESEESFIDDPLGIAKPWELSDEKDEK